MRAGFRQSMAWLHTWAGLLVCWVLFMIFCAGSASYFRDEISLWMKPELHRIASNPANVTSADAASNAVRFLEKEAPASDRWFISLPSPRRDAVGVLWTFKPGKGPLDASGKPKRFETRALDPATGNPLPEARETRGGEFLYRLHYDLHYMSPIWARWIVGVCAMFMFVAILSGVITHKRIFVDFFTFRRRKGQRSWLDAHNALAVLALPFHLMITYTGFVTLLFMYMPWGIQAAYQGNMQAFQAETLQRPVRPKPGGERAPLMPVGPMVEQAEQRWGGAHPSRLTVNGAGTTNATVTVTRSAPRALSNETPTLEFSGATGKLVRAYAEDPSGADETRSVMAGLHIANFATPGLRALFFLCGLAGAAMVATGAVLWAVKTRQQQAKAIAKGARAGFGLRLVEALNIGAIAGLPIAFATYFWANRLLPVDMAMRQENEIRWFFVAWAAAAVLAQIRPTRGMWRAQFWIGALLFCGIPVLNAITTDTHLGVTLLRGEGPAAVAGFDLTVFALGLGLAGIAWHLARKRDAKAGAGSKAKTKASPTTGEAFAHQPQAVASTADHGMRGQA